MDLECFLLHFRNLRAFLCPSPRFGADDVLASDFLGMRTAKDIGDSAKLDRDKTRLDKMLAHVTYSRSAYVQASDHRWNIEGMLIPMLDELQKFVAMLPAEQRAWFQSIDWLRAQRSQAQARLVP